METNVSIESNVVPNHSETQLRDAANECNEEATEAILVSEAVDSLEIPLKELNNLSEGKADPVGLMDLSLEKVLSNIQKEEWYHGSLPLEDILGLLKNNGDFLIRELDPEGDRTSMACITVNWNGTVKDFPIHHMTLNNEHIFTIDGINKHDNIMELIRYHHSSRTPVNANIVLLNPIPKQAWELSSEKVKLITKIGSGAFGEVWQGIMNEDPNKPPVDVAVKVTKLNEENKALMDAMYKEARLMRQYKHKNVVTFYGVAQKGNDNAMIVMEYINGGSLRDYLKKNTGIPVKTKIGYAIDVAVGLVYLHSKGCMHRDVACRNCLIDVKKNLVKISDFGLSKQADSYKIPDTERLAIKWQAPEVILTRVYTVKSDVYSYGILLWEIFNNGEPPFKGINNKTVRSKISDPKFRPPVSPNLPIVVIRVMKTCWRRNVKKRPTMAQVARYLIYAPSELLLPKSQASVDGTSTNASTPAKQRNSSEAASQTPRVSRSKSPGSQPLPASRSTSASSGQSPSKSKGSLGDCHRNRTSRASNRVALRRPPSVGKGRKKT